MLKIAVSCITVCKQLIIDVYVGQRGSVVDMCATAHVIFILCSDLFSQWPFPVSLMIIAPVNSELWGSAAGHSWEGLDQNKTPKI